MPYQFEQTTRVFKLSTAGHEVFPIDLEGVRTQHNALTFDKLLYDEVTASIGAAAFLGESLQLRAQSFIKSSVTDADLKDINAKIGGAPLSKEDVFVYRRAVINNRTSDRISLRIQPPAFQKYKLDCDGMGVQRNMHHDSRNIVGVIYGADVVDGTINGIEGLHLMTREYMVARDAHGNPMNGDHIMNVRARIYKSDSATLFPGGAIKITKERAGRHERSVINLSFDPNLPEYLHTQMDEVSFVDNPEIKGAGHVMRGKTVSSGKNEKTVVSLSGIDVPGITLVEPGEEINLSGKNEKPDVSPTEEPENNHTRDIMSDVKNPFSHSGHGVHVAFQLGANEDPSKVQRLIESYAEGVSTNAVNAVDAEHDKTKLELKAAKSELDKFKDDYIAQTLSLGAASFKLSGKNFEQTADDLGKMSFDQLASVRSSYEMVLDSHKAITNSTNGATKEESNFEFA